jgi:MFS family permease
MPAAAQPDDDPMTARVTAVAALVAGYMLAFVVRYGTAVALPGLRADLDAGAAALGVLAAAYFWPYAVMQPVAGVLADRWGPRRAMAVFLTVAAAGTALFAAAPSLPAAVAGRALGGAGVGIVYVCALSAIGHWCRPQHFGTASGLFAASGILGGLLAARPLAALVDAVGWRGAFALIALALLGTAVLAAATIPAGGQRAALAPSPLAGLGRALRLPTLWRTGAYTFVILGIISAMQGLWTVPFVTDLYGLAPRQAATVLEAWSTGLLVGIPAWGWLADRLRWSWRGTILLSLGLHTPVWVLLAVAPTAWPRAGLYALVCYAAFTGGCWMPAYALVRATAPAAIAGTALGLLNCCFFLGAAVFQQGTGLLLGGFTPRAGQALPAPAYQTLFACFSVALVLVALLLLTDRESLGVPYREHGDAGDK